MSAPNGSPWNASSSRDPCFNAYGPCTDAAWISPLLTMAGQAESAERAWFRRNGYREDPEEWQAVDLETGELTASFRLEPGMRVKSIRAGRVAAVWQDDLGVSYVTVFALAER